MGTTTLGSCGQAGAARPRLDSGKGRGTERGGGVGCPRLGRCEEAGTDPARPHSGRRRGRWFKREGVVWRALQSCRSDVLSCCCSLPPARSAVGGEESEPLAHQPLRRTVSLPHFVPARYRRRYQSAAASCPSKGGWLSADAWPALRHAAWITLARRQFVNLKLYSRLPQAFGAPNGLSTTDHADASLPGGAAGHGRPGLRCAARPGRSAQARRPSRHRTMTPAARLPRLRQPRQLLVALGAWGPLGTAPMPFCFFSNSPTSQTPVLQPIWWSLTLTSVMRRCACRPSASARGTRRPSPPTRSPSSSWCARVAAQGGRHRRARAAAVGASVSGNAPLRPHLPAHPPRPNTRPLPL